MDAPLTPLTPHARAVLRDADRRLMALAGAGTDRYALYTRLRAAATAYAPRTDSFYVGFGRGDGTVVYPYNFDGREYDDPNVNTYAPGGLTEWVLTRGRAYRAESDGGALLHRGRAFGDTSRRSRAAVAVPLRDGKDVIGIVAMLSYSPDAFGPDAVRFLSCLTDSLAAALRRGREDAGRRRRFGDAPDETAPDADDAPPTLAGAVEAVNRSLGAVRRRAEALRTALPPGTDEAARAAAADLCRACERAQTEVTEQLLRAAASEENPLRRLSAREREVAALLAAGRTNREIGETLFISELTAKTHCQNILRKLGVRGRSAVAERLRPFVVGVSTPSE